MEHSHIMPRCKYGPGQGRLKLGALHIVRIADSLVFFATLGFYDPEMYSKLLFSRYMDDI